MSEVRLRRDGPGDSIASVDAFKITRHGAHEWHVKGLYPWSQAMLDKFYAAARARNDHPSVFVHDLAGSYTAELRANAVYFCEEAAKLAASGR